MTNKPTAPVTPGILIKRRIEETSITQKELAFRADISQQYLADMLLGRRVMQPRIARTIFASLNMPESQEKFCVKVWLDALLDDWKHWGLVGKDGGAL